MLDTFPMDQIRANILKVLPNMTKICKQTLSKRQSRNEPIPSKKHMNHFQCQQNLHAKKVPNISDQNKQRN